MAPFFFQTKSNPQAASSLAHLYLNPTRTAELFLWITFSPPSTHRQVISTKLNLISPFSLTCPFLWIPSSSPQRFLFLHVILPHQWFPPCHGLIASFPSKQTHSSSSNSKATSKTLFSLDALPTSGHFFITFPPSQASQKKSLYPKSVSSVSSLPSMVFIFHL